MWADDFEIHSRQNMACGHVTITWSNFPPHPASLTRGANFEADPGQETENQS